MSLLPRSALWLLPILLLLHQNYWLWGSGDLLFGWPVNLLYHVVLCLLVAALMLVVALWAWPSDLDRG